MMKLKTLEIKALRGIRDWLIPFEGKSLLLWGETGSGKSSVVDALEFLFTEQVRHLVGIRGLSVAHHAPHVELGRDAMEVSASFDPGAVQVSRSLTSEVCVPPVLRKLWVTASSGAFILRRSQILEFIHRDPADRFRAIASMIGAEPLDEIEVAMMRVSDHAKGKCEAQEQEVQRITTRLADVVRGEASTPQAAQALLNVEVAALDLEPLTSLEAVTPIVQNWLRSAKIWDQTSGNSIQKLKGAAEAARIPEGLDTQIADYVRAHSSLFLERSKLDRLSELELLVHGEKILAETSPQRCPLCEQDIDSQDTLSRIRARRELLLQLSDEVSAIRQKQQALLGPLRSLRQRVHDLEALLLVIPEETRGEIEIAVLELGRQCDAATGTVESSTKFTEKCSVDGFTAAIPRYGQVCAQIIEWSDDQLGELALTDRDRSILSLAQRANDLARLQSELIREKAKLQKAQEYECRTRYVFEAFSSLKKTEVAGIYDAIQADIRTFYEVLHPDEPHGNFRLVLTEGRRASTELRITSFGRTDEDPRAFTSESHLDSLGLCIFLAFVKRFGAECPLVVLDDVVMSVDAPHRSRVAELLLTEFEDWQLIITTHDEIWFEEIVNHERAYGADGRFINLRIHRWSLQEGPTVRPYKPRWQRIETKLSEADKTGAANDGRQFLEWILIEICTSTEAPVPLKMGGGYMVVDVLDPARIRLAKLLPSFRAQIDCLFEEITAAGTPKNLLSHYNANAQSASLTEIQRFCNAGKALADWYQCPSCGSIPKYIRELRIIRCSNGRCDSPKQWNTR